MLTVTDFIIPDKQQKGSFYINGYSAELVSNLRKDSKKNCCFEMHAPGRRSYQVCLPTLIHHWLFRPMFALLQCGLIICTDNSVHLCDVDFSLQFAASNPREAREWVDQINFVLKGRLHGVQNSLCHANTL